MIVFKVLDDALQVKGAVVVPGWEGGIDTMSVSFGASKQISYKEEKVEGSRPDLGSVSLTFLGGPWTAILQEAMNKGKMLGKVDIADLKQEGDGGGAYKKRRVINFEGATIDSLSHSWSGIESTVSLTFHYSKITYTWGDKVGGYDANHIGPK